MKKNLPSPTRRTVVEIRVNKLQTNPASGHIERGARPLPATETEFRSRPRQSGDTLRDEAARWGAREGGREEEEKTKW